MTKVKMLELNISIGHNTKADMISLLAIVKKKGLHRPVIYINLKNPNVGANECMTTKVQTIWMTPIK